jgi:hypothetical protein
LKRHYSIRTASCILLGLSFLIGCATREPLPNFFVLTGAGPRGARTPVAGETVVLVRLAEVPTYLAKSSLVTMIGGIEVKYSATQRWRSHLIKAYRERLRRISVEIQKSGPTGFLPERLRSITVTTFGSDWNALRAMTTAKSFCARAGPFQVPGTLLRSLAGQSTYAETAGNRETTPGLFDC